LLDFHFVKDEKLVSKMEGKTNFKKRPKQFDGSTRLIVIPYFTTDLRQWI